MQSSSNEQDNNKLSWEEKTAFPPKSLPKFETHALKFEIHAKCGKARCSTLTLPHGPCRTPMFMPFGYHCVFFHLYPSDSLYFYMYLFYYPELAHKEP